MTAFERDILNVIRDGHSFYGEITRELQARGRSRVHEMRLMRAMGRLRITGKITTSVAGRNTVNDANAQFEQICRVNDANAQFEQICRVNDANAQFEQICRDEADAGETVVVGRKVQP